MSEFLRTPLYDLHVRLGARMAPFAGYEMPIQYPAGVKTEHLATRAEAGLFDVSHMGQVVLRPRSGKLVDTMHDLESLVPVDIVGLAKNRQRYGFFTNEQGGIIDDLMITNRGDHLFLVINAACKAVDIAHMRENLKATDIEVLDRGLIALQGPAAEAALASLNPKVAAMRFMDVAMLSLNGADCLVSRSGYSGEDGFEISVPQEAAAALADLLLTKPGVWPIGLGARDSLRLEAGLCLYGHDIDSETSPVEASLNWAIQKVRRKGGARAGGFPGADRILPEFESGPARRRVGLRPEGRAPMREGTPLHADAEGGPSCGVITSGGFGPSVEGPVAMGYLPTELCDQDTIVYGALRGKYLPLRVTKLPFITPTYKR